MIGLAADLITTGLDSSKQSDYRTEASLNLVVNPVTETVLVTVTVKQSVSSPLDSHRSSLRLRFPASPCLLLLYILAP
jgi:hypothetical protein